MSRYDILIYPSDFDKRYSLVEDEGGNLVGSTGLLTLLSCLIRVLLTSRGSVPAAPAEGTSLKSLVGGVYNRSTISVAITREVALARDYIIAEQTASGVPRDERLASVEVVKINADVPGELSITLLVASSAGEAATTTVVVEE